MANLTNKQKNDLKALLDPSHHAKSRGITNPTMRALRTRGLVELRRVPSEHVPNHGVLQWIITDAGRSALSVNEQETS